MKWASTIEIDPQKIIDSIVSVFEKWGGQSGILHYYRDYGTGEYGYEFCNWFCVFLLCAPSEREAGQAGPESGLCDLTCETVEYLGHVCTLASKVFSSFITGQCIEAVILGSMFFVSMTIGRFPYA